MQARSAVFKAQGRGDVAAVGAAEEQLRAGPRPPVRGRGELPGAQGRRGLPPPADAASPSSRKAIADRRELYNEAVNLNNIRIQTFPDLIVARMFDFKPASLLEFTDEQKRDVDLGKLFG